MSQPFNNPVVGVAIVVLGGILLFVPSIIARLRRIRAFPSISAINALILLLLVCTLASHWFFLGSVALWIATTAWSITGRRRDP
jgi:uncharacterized membrane protein YhaH (DUF805 family)